MPFKDIEKVGVRIAPKGHVITFAQREVCAQLDGGKSTIGIVHLHSTCGGPNRAMATKVQ